MQHRALTRLTVAAVAAIAALVAAPPVTAQVYTPPLVQVFPGVYRPALGAMLPQAIDYGTPVYGAYGYQRPMYSRPVAASNLARVDAPFQLQQVSEEQLNESVTRSYYVANNVAVTLTPQYGRTIRLVGQVEVVTETTLDESGNGSIEGLLTFTARSRNGYEAQLLSLRLTGEVSDTAGPLLAEGQLNIPATTANEVSLTANVSASLASDGNLNARLSGMAEATTY